MYWLGKSLEFSFVVSYNSLTVGDHQFMFLLRKFDTSWKKETKMIKHKFYDKKHQSKCEKSRWKYKVAFSFWTTATNPWCNML